MASPEYNERLNICRMFGLSFDDTTEEAAFRALEAYDSRPFGSIQGLPKAERIAVVRALWGRRQEERKAGGPSVIQRVMEDIRARARAAAPPPPPATNRERVRNVQEDLRARRAPAPRPPPEEPPTPTPSISAPDWLTGDMGLDLMLYSEELARVFAPLRAQGRSLEEAIKAMRIKPVWHERLTVEDLVPCVEPYITDPGRLRGVREAQSKLLLKIGATSMTPNGLSSKRSKHKG